MFLPWENVLLIILYLIFEETNKSQVISSVLPLIRHTYYEKMYCKHDLINLWRNKKITDNSKGASSISHFIPLMLIIKFPASNTSIVFHDPCFKRTFHVIPLNSSSRKKMIFSSRFIRTFLRILVHQCVCTRSSSTY